MAFLKIMAKKCRECGETIEEDSLGKLQGTIVKKKVGKKNQLEYVCSDCQKQGKDKEVKK